MGSTQMMPLDKEFDPPAAVVPVTIENPLNGKRETTRALIDTGADITAVPRQLVKTLELAPHAKLPIVGIDGLWLDRHTYVVNIDFPDLRVDHRIVIAWEGDFCVIGRDFLTEFTLTYNGKEGTFQFQDP